jgi:periplasmic divalent cation tolerance protein
MQAEDFVVVLVTAGSSEEAERIAAALVEDGLAACVNIVGPIRSVYRWRGAVERAEEHLLVIKARRASFAALSARVHELHSYDTPEVVALPITAAAEAYLAWLALPA